jgi:hypothetical protein
MQKTHDDIAVLCAYAKLVEAVIREAMKINQETTYSRKVINIRFARTSPLLEHYCDVWQLDKRRVMDAIVRVNKKNIFHEV